MSVLEDSVEEEEETKDDGEKKKFKRGIYDFGE